LYIDHRPIKWLMTNDKLIGKLVHWVLILQEYEFKVITDLVLHIRTRIPCRKDPSLPLKISWKLGKTSTRFQEYMYFMDLVIFHYCNVTWLNIPLWIYGRTWTLWGFFSMGNTSPKLYQIIKIKYNSGPNATHGATITLSDVYHKVTKWFFHHMNGLVLFRRYTRSLDTLELSIFITFSLLITIGEVCMLKFETSLLGVNNVIEWELPFPLNSSRFLHSLLKACSIPGHVI
jgi:hypothetical protein